MAAAASAKAETARREAEIARIEAEIARLEAETERKAQMLTEMVEFAARIAEKRALVELRREIAEDGARAESEKSGRRVRGPGKVGDQAQLAAFLVFERVGASDFPDTAWAAARAIVAAAATFGISPPDKPLHPDSSSVKKVAKLMIEATEMLKRRDDQG